MAEKLTQIIENLRRDGHIVKAAKAEDNLILIFIAIRKSEYENGFSDKIKSYFHQAYGPGTLTDYYDKKTGDLDLFYLPNK